MMVPKDAIRMDEWMIAWTPAEAGRYHTPEMIPGSGKLLLLKVDHTQPVVGQGAISERRYRPLIAVYGLRDPLLPV